MRGLRRCFVCFAVAITFACLAACNSSGCNCYDVAPSADYYAEVIAKGLRAISISISNADPGFDQPAQKTDEIALATAAVKNM